MTLRALAKQVVPRHNSRMRHVCVLTLLIALSLGLSACSKCDVYRHWTGPYSCTDTAPPK